MNKIDSSDWILISIAIVLITSLGLGLCVQMYRLKEERKEKNTTECINDFRKITDNKIEL